MTSSDPMPDEYRSKTDPLITNGHFNDHLLLETS